jgi:hypothetical protein
LTLGMALITGCLGVTAASLCSQPHDGVVLDL